MLKCVSDADDDDVVAGARLVGVYLHPYPPSTSLSQQRQLHRPQANMHWQQLPLPPQEHDV